MNDPTRLPDGFRVWDAHIHIAGNRTDETGCWLHPRWRRSLAFGFLRRHAGAKTSDVDAGMEMWLTHKLRRLLDEAPCLERAVLLAYDWPRDECGEPLRDDADFYVPNDFVLSVARTDARFLPAASIHPLRSDALEELCRVAEAGAVLVKWLPVSQNFSPTHERCRPFYAEAARLGMPLLVHTGSEGATRIFDKRWNHPRVLIPALEAGCTVIAAHAGLRSFPHDRDYGDDWAALLKDYPRLYGDTSSCMALRARGLVRLLDKPLVAERLVHGSDWPVPTTPWWLLGKLPLATIRAIAAIRHPLLQDIATKRALGVPDAVFSRLENVLRREAAPAGA